MAGGESSANQGCHSTGPLIRGSQSADRLFLQSAKNADVRSGEAGGHLSIAGERLAPMGNPMLGNQHLHCYAGIGVAVSGSRETPLLAALFISGFSLWEHHAVYSNSYYCTAPFSNSPSLGVKENASGFRGSTTEGRFVLGHGLYVESLKLVLHKLCQPCFPLHCSAISLLFLGFCLEIAHTSAP